MIIPASLVTCHKSAQRESVIQIQKRCDEQFEDFEDYEDEKSLNDIKDIPMEGKYDEDEDLIFHYLHKKFNSKKRDWTGKAKDDVVPHNEEVTQEGTSKWTEYSNT